MRLAARLTAACCAAVALISAVAGPAFAARTQHVTATTTTLRLLSQQAFVRDQTGLNLQLSVSSPLPDSRIGLKVVLYSEVSTRDTFQETLSGTEPSSELPIDSVPAGGTIPLSAIDHNGLISLHLPIAAGTATHSSLTSPSLSLDCAASTYCPGVYPLELVLLDSRFGTQLASLTTYLVYTPPQSGALKLDVAIVLPLGQRPALAPGGGAELADDRLDALGSLAAELARATPDTVSVDLYPQVLTALSRAPRAASRAILGHLALALGGGAPTEALVAAPFADVDVEALAAAGLDHELASQLVVGRRIDGATLHRTPSVEPLVTTHPLDGGGLRLLEGEGIRQLVLPAASLAGTPPAGTRVAPVRLEGGASGPAAEAFAADPGLAVPFTHANTDPALAAEQFLAELAVVYFEYPFAPTQRAVVVTPTTDGSSAFLSTVLAGLDDSPIIRPITLPALFSLWPRASSLAAATLVAPANGRSSGTAGSSTVSRARAELAALGSVVPKARSLITDAGDSILLGEAAGLSSAQRDGYESAAKHDLARIANALSLAGKHTVTLTARSGPIPVTVVSQFPAALHLVMRVRSSGLTFPSGTRFSIVLTKEHLTSVPVRTLTSGVTTMEVSLLSPVGGVVLTSGRFSIRSTAISGVAIGLSAAALAVLAVWWLRSILRRRRRSGAARGGQPAGAAPSHP